MSFAIVPGEVSPPPPNHPFMSDASFILPNSQKKKIVREIAKLLIGDKYDLPTANYVILINLCCLKTML
jgi:hypothetical protein